jgi:hypothetical protein
LKIYRQKVAGDWTDPVIEIRDYLKQVIDSTVNHEFRSVLESWN